ncbi:MAG: PAS domain S-box protein [Nitrospira sp.]|nr:PAS domain S-box protein [Nitrospira sp.]
MEPHDDPSARMTDPFAVDLMSARLAAIVESSDDAIISKDLNGVIKSWNRGAQRLFGYTAEDMIGQPVQRLIPPDRFDEEPRILERIRKGQRIDHYETVRQRKDGSLVHISLTVSPIKDGRGRIVGASKIARDITERKQAERHLAHLVDALPAAVFTTDAKGLVTHYNQAAVTLCGSRPTSDVALWHGSWRLIGPDGQPIMEQTCPLRQSLTGGCPPSGLEALIERPDGSLVPVTHHSTPLRQDSGELLGTVNMLVDLTERKDREHQLHAAASELEQRIAERTQELLSSQERLRALASELTLTEQRERRRLATELHDYLAQLVVASRLRLSQLIPRVKDHSVSTALAQVDTMLDQALTYTRSLVAELSPQILYQFGLAKSLLWLGEQMKQHNLRVSVTLGSAPFTVPDDQAVLLFQSVRELLFNIIKHAQTDHAALTVNVDERHELWICVEDEGSGFDLAELSKSGDTHGKFGLLSIRERMELLGGECELSSSPGVGTLAILHLPLLQAAADVSANPPPAFPSSSGALTEDQTKTVRVLLVDDHAMVRQGLRSILDSYTDLTVVGEAANGQDAVVMARSLRPDVVVMDVNLPLIDGVEATRLLCREHSSMAVIGISVRNDPQVKLAMTEAGAADFLPKESAAGQLYDIILRHCPVAS